MRRTARQICLNGLKKRIFIDRHDKGIFISSPTRCCLFNIYKSSGVGFKFSEKELGRRKFPMQLMIVYKSKKH